MVERRMPSIRRHSLPPALLRHLLERIQQRGISADQLGLLASGSTGSLTCRPENGSSDYPGCVFVVRESW
jgi:ribosomal protein S18 acetylase RimI-like enzyme